MNNRITLENTTVKHDEKHSQMVTQTDFRNCKHLKRFEQCLNDCDNTSIFRQIIDIFSFT